MLLGLLIVTAPAWGRAGDSPEPAAHDPDATAAVPPDGAGKASGKLDLRLKMPRAIAGIEGDWQYHPLDGGAPYTVMIRKSQKGFYEYEGRRADTSAIVLQMDRGTESMVYRGEVAEDFDACIPAGARFTLNPTLDALTFEPSMPVLIPVATPPPGPCTQARTYVLVAKGHGDLVRFKAPGDLAGGPQQPGIPDPPDGRMPPRTPPSKPERNPAANVTLGVPTAADGARVVLLGSLRDANDRVWHHVRLLDPPLPEADSDHAARQAPVKDKGDRSRSAPSTGSGGSASASDPSKKLPVPTEPPSGYVAAASLIVRWECRLQHVADAAETNSPPETPR